MTSVFAMFSFTRPLILTPLSHLSRLSRDGSLQGFMQMKHGLYTHARCEQLYFLLFAALLGRNVHDIPFGMAVDEEAFNAVFGVCGSPTSACSMLSVCFICTCLG